MEYLLYYTPQAPNKKWVNDNRAKKNSSDNITIFSLKGKRKKIKRKNYFLLFDINCRYHFYYEIVQPL